MAAPAHPRKSIDGVSANLAIGGSSTHKPKSIYDDKLKQENFNAVFERSESIITEVGKTLSKVGNDKEIAEAAYVDFTINSMCEQIFGSNMIEQVGLKLDETIKLCRRVFDGEDVRADAIDANSEEYQEQLEALIPPAKDAAMSEVIQSRREVIQHAQAFKHLLDHAITRHEPLTERLILQVHRILCEGMPLSQDHTAHLEYAGQYRSTEARAGHTSFCLPADVPSHMANFIAGFNQDISDRETSGNMDPFFLAADICQDFVMIHPFADGNGRICRMLANMYTIKYAGVVVNIGEQDEDRKQYLNIVIYTAEQDEEEGRRTLTGFVLERAAKTLKRLREKMQV